MSFISDLNNYMPRENSLALWWLGQAGFMIKTSGGTRILIDPYLSDYVNRSLGPEMGLIYKRMTPRWIEPEDLKPDYYFCSHEHQDHLDLDAVCDIMKGNPNTKGFINITSLDEIRKVDVNESRFRVLHREETVDFLDFSLTVTDCNHGDGSPEALGFFFDFGFVSVYYAGDTCFDPVRLHYAIEHHPDIALLPINGAYGNLNATEAAQLAALAQVKQCVPMHFWTFPEHDRPGGSPLDLIKIFPEKAKDCNLCLLTPGEMAVFGVKGKLLSEPGGVRNDRDDS